MTSTRLEIGACDMMWKRVTGGESTSKSRSSHPDFSFSVSSSGHMPVESTHDLNHMINIGL